MEHNDSNMSKMDQVLTGLRGRHKQMDNLMALTKEMGNALEFNDLESLGAVLSMRQETMAKIDSANTEVFDVIKSLDQPYRDKMKKVLKQEAEPSELENPLEAGIFDTNRMTFLLLQKIIDLDGAINERVTKTIFPT
ncbi:MAG: hypothetical protein FWG53_04460 [Clostridiales bacterium]|nr:hypothetical protein [Clostridiales bacterium]